MAARACRSDDAWPDRREFAGARGSFGSLTAWMWPAASASELGPRVSGEPGGFSVLRLSASHQGQMCLRGQQIAVRGCRLARASWSPTPAVCFKPVCPGRPGQGQRIRGERSQVRMRLCAQSQP